MKHSRGGNMNTEDIPLDIKGIFDRKGMKYDTFEIAMTRYLCRKFVEYLIDMQKQRDKNGIR